MSQKRLVQNPHQADGVHQRKQLFDGDHDQVFHDHYHDDDEGCNADVDDYYDDVFTDAMEVLSLTEAIDIVKKAEKFHGSGLEHSDLCPSPNFIIKRFLPDAAILAATSALNMSKTKLPYLCSYSEQWPCVSQAVIKRSSFASAKRCGLEMLLPWRMKHKLCGVKSPIKESSNIAQPKTSAKQRKLFSSIDAPSGEWRCK